MTEKEIRSIENSLYDKYRGVSWKEWSPQDKRKSREISFRDWVNSCLCYGNLYELSPDKLQEYDYSINKSTLDLYEVKLNRALQLIEQQKKDFAKATVVYNVYTDSEGCSYNRIVWADER